MEDTASGMRLFSGAVMNREVHSRTASILTDFQAPGFNLLSSTCVDYVRLGYQNQDI